MSAPEEEPNGVESMSVESHLERIGTGWYQVILVIAVGGATMAEAIEMGAVAPINTALVRDFGWSDTVRVSLPWLTYGGAALGLGLSGFVADGFGRRLPVLMSLVGMATCMYLTATSTGTPVSHLLALRVLASLFAMLQLPAGRALVAESCTKDIRAQLFFGISFMGACGYVIEAVGMLIYMPMFGEWNTDDWRAFCRFIAAFSVIIFPFAAFLSESPCFLSICGDSEQADSVLNRMAWYNGVPPVARTTLLPDPVESSRGGRERSPLDDIMQLFTGQRATVLLVLVVAEGSKSFFISGSAYIQKDFFVLLHDETEVSGAMWSVIASISPLVGLFVGWRLLWMGVRRVYIAVAICSFLATYALSQESMRTNPAYALPLIMLMKASYGTLNTCLCLLTVESFQTETRASAMAIVGVAGKVLCAYSPSLLEHMRGGHEAKNWSLHALSLYLFFLMGNVLLSAVMVYILPGYDTADALEHQDQAKPHTPAKSVEPPLYGATKTTKKLGSDASDGRSEKMQWRR